MPRSIQEILDRADQLAERFEKYDPANATSSTPSPQRDPRAFHGNASANYSARRRKQRNGKVITTS